MKSARRNLIRLQVVAGLFSCLIVFPACGGGPALQHGNPNASLATLTVSNNPVFDFTSHDVDSVTSQVFTITNSGTGPATRMAGSFDLAANYGFAGGNYPGTGGTCHDLLVPLSSCTVNVEFHPQYAGDFQTLLAVSYFDGSQMQATAAPQIRGKGVWEMAGSFDKTLAGTGQLSLGIGTGITSGRAIGVQTDGKIVVAGYSHVNGFDVFAAARFALNGTLDSSFGNGGVTAVSVGTGDSRVSGLAVVDDGTIVLGGTAVSGGRKGFAAARLRSDGVLDSTFGTGGLVVVAVGTADAEAKALLLQPDRKVVLGGFASRGTNHDFATVRLNTNGTPDTLFGTSGVVLTPIGSGDELIEALGYWSGRIIAGGTSQGADNDFAVVRLLSDGTLDAQFGTGGITVFGMGTATQDRLHGLSVSDDGSLVVVGESTGTSSEFAVAKLLPGGALDGTFGTAGRVTASFGVGDAAAYSVAVQSDKRVVVLGSTGSPTDQDIASLRLSAHGTLDTSWGMNGKIINSLSPGNDVAYAAAFSANGKILVTGETTVSGLVQLVLLRYWP